MRGTRIATLFGIPLEIHPSWYLVFGLVLWSLASGVFGRTAPPGAAWLMAFTTTFLFFASLVTHELAHALVSRHHGLAIRRIVLFIFGGVSEATQELPSPRVELQVALAGPFTSFLLALGFGGLAVLWHGPWSWGAGAEVASWLALVNGALGLFNLLPGFPLDGGRVVRAIAWRLTGDLRRATRLAGRGGQAVGALMMLWGVVRLAQGELVGALWIGMLGYLLVQAAGSQVVEQEALGVLGQVRVSELMSGEPVVLDPDMTLQQVVDGYLLHHPYGGYPVVASGVIGLLQASTLRAVPLEARPRTRVRDVMLPLGPQDLLRPDEGVAEAVQRMARLEVGRLPVVEDGGLVGMLSQSDVVRYLTWRQS